MAKCNRQGGRPIKITLQKPSESGTGYNLSRTFKNFGVAMASFQVLRGGEIVAGGQSQAIAQYRLRMRSTSGTRSVTPKWRITFQRQAGTTITQEVVRAYDGDQSGREVVLETVEEQ